ncbi:NAD(P)-dependent oxidoreductase [Xylanimonas allomyrinae]|uniref:NAD(P)-dependent oxidoreductase n=1 Tax=Xylanimonas allomyrinae TaxID=2509459 RepID=A0A4P6END2_9MICO|nr:NAD(P)-dependent oxidoreductase [Xylanimonas allomyrinae]QAY64214.1 NAD(P)-dependent oxidoreductase [Xylanimonas allomyrinae]
MPSRVLPQPRSATTGRVVVTGAAGRLGVAVVEDLTDHGWDVVAVDQTPPPARAPGRFVTADLTDYGQVAELMSGFDESAPATAVVHLAAVPAPGLRPDAATFANNVPATYNVFRAARAAGVRNVVWASSETVLGLPFAVPPVSVPVDEEMPVQPWSTYALGKVCEEELARHLVRWDPELKMVALRFSNVMHPQDYLEFDTWQDDASARRWNMWSYIDARDGAQATRRALEADLVGFEAFIIANSDTCMRRDSADLLDEQFPGIERTRAIRGRESLLSIDKARRLLGYEPRHSWTT